LPGLFFKPRWLSRSLPAGTSIPCHSLLPHATPPGARFSTGRDHFPLGKFRHFSHSSQSPFHLSLTVLVRYRSPAAILPWMEFTTLLGSAFPSKPTRRRACRSFKVSPDSLARCSLLRGSHPLWRPLPRDLQEHAILRPSLPCGCYTNACRT